MTQPSEAAVEAAARAIRKVRNDRHDPDLAFALADVVCDLFAKAALRAAYAVDFPETQEERK